MTGGWMVKGRRLRRSVREDEKIVGTADGEIVGWLPAEKARYVIMPAPVALWRVLYDDDALGRRIWKNLKCGMQSNGRTWVRIV